MVYKNKKYFLFVSLSFVLFLFSAFRPGVGAYYSVSEPFISNTEVMTAPELRRELIETAKKYLGSRYRSNGRGPKAFDCSGFTSFVYRHFGVELESSSRGQSQVGKRVPLHSVQPGDLLFFAVKGHVHHVGIVVKNSDDQLWMIHSSTSRGVIIEEVLHSDYWRKRLLLARDMVAELSLSDTNIDTF